MSIVQVALAVVCGVTSYNATTYNETTRPENYTGFARLAERPLALPRTTGCDRPAFLHS